MIVITVARKPLSEANVATNVLKHGAGAINVDACRILVTDGTVLGRNNKPGPNGWKNSSGGPSAAMSNPAAAAGRWPANLVLQHLKGCQQKGVKRVRGNPGGITGGGRTLGGMNDDGWKPQSLPRQDHADPDGMETIGAWVCLPGCPVAHLDEQSGDTSTQQSRTNPAAGTMNTGMFGIAKKQKNGPEYLGDTGGASRYFKQVGGKR